VYALRWEEASFIVENKRPRVIFSCVRKTPVDCSVSFTYALDIKCVFNFSVHICFKARDDGVVVQLLIFWTLSIALYYKQRFRDWTRYPSSGEDPTQLGPIDRASPYLPRQGLYLETCLK
jgi:hypothetical protein